jgi:hypothetical protein
MGRSASAASNPFSSSLRELAAFWSVRKPSAPDSVEIAARLFREWSAENVHGFRGHRYLSPPGESLSTWVDRWDYEARILEVDGIILTAPHTTP